MNMCTNDLGFVFVLLFSIFLLSTFFHILHLFYIFFWRSFLVQVTQSCFFLNNKACFHRDMILLITRFVSLNVLLEVIVCMFKN